MICSKFCLCIDHCWWQSKIEMTAHRGTEVHGYEICYCCILLYVFGGTPYWVHVQSQCPFLLPVLPILTWVPRNFLNRPHSYMSSKELPMSSPFLHELPGISYAFVGKFLYHIVHIVVFNMWSCFRITFLLVTTVNWICIFVSDKHADKLLHTKKEELSLQF